MIKKVLLVSLFLSSVFSKDFIREYTYTVGDNDSKNSARAFAINEVKKLLIEEIGVHMNSKLQIEKTNINGKYQKKSKKTIETITAGITKTEILKENYNGVKYNITAKISIDIESFHKKLLQILKKEDIVNQLKNITKEKNHILNQNIKLETSLNKEKEKLSHLKKELEELKRNKISSLKKELEVKNSQISLLEKNLSLENNKQKLQLNQLVQLGNESYYNNYYHQAISYYIASEYLGYNNALIKFNIANAYYKLGDYENSIKNYKRYIKTNDKNIEAYNNIAMAYQKTGKVKEAINYYHKVLKIDSFNNYTYNNLGILYYNLGHLKKAIYNFKKAASLGNEKAKKNLKSIME